MQTILRYTFRQKSLALAKNKKLTLQPPEAQMGIVCDKLILELIIKLKNHMFFQFIIGNFYIFSSHFFSISNCQFYIFFIGFFSTSN